MNRKISYWKLRTTELQLGERTMIMGILNVTPDSFSDGGRFNDPDRAYARALELEAEGADIIDIGAESTKPGSKRITADEEWQRLVPILKRLRGQLSVPLSIDTYKAEIAERALEYGIEIINDPSGLTLDPGLAKVAAEAHTGLILSHMRGTPESWAKLPPLPDVADTVTRELDATVNRARHAGVERQRIVVDPGLGFGKRKEQNAEMIAHLKELIRLECPVMIGPSRKHFLAQETEEETRMATAAAVTAGILNGAHIVRVHDVKLIGAAIHYADEIARAARVLTRSEREEAEREEAKAEARNQRMLKRSAEPERHMPPRPPLLRKPEPIAEPTVEPVVPPSESEEEVLPKVEAAEVTEETPTAEAPPVESAPPPAERKTYERKPYERKPYERKPMRDGSAPPKRPFSDRAQRADGPPRTGRPPRPDGPPRTDRPRFERTDRPARSDRAPGTDRPPRRFDDKRSGPPRTDRPRTDRPPRRFDDTRSGPPRSGPPRSGPPRSGPPRTDRPPRRFDDTRSGPPRGDRPPRRDAPPRGDRPPRGDGPPPFKPRGGPKRSGPGGGGFSRGPDRGPGGGAGGRPPKRPFRKRP